MQTYSDYHLLRFYSVRVITALGLFFLMSISVFAEEQIEITERDSLYVQWSKTKSAFPLLKYTISDPENIDQYVFAEQLIRQYGIGLVGIKNPDVRLVGSWIKDLQAKKGRLPIFMLEMARPFELTYGDWSGQLAVQQVEINTDEEIGKRLAKFHATMLIENGFSMIHFETIPQNYATFETRKVYDYLKELDSIGIMMSFGTGANHFLVDHQEMLNWSNVKLIDESLAWILSPGLIKKSKKFRKEISYKGLIGISRIGQEELLSKKSNPFNRGLNIVQLTNDETGIRQIMNSLVEAELPKKGYFKRGVHRFYRALNLPDVEIDQRSIQSMAYSQLQLDLETYVLVKNDLNLLPVKDLSNEKIFTLSKDQSDRFSQYVDYYKVSTHYAFNDIIGSRDSLRVHFADFNLGLIDLTSLDRKELLYTINNLRSIIDLQKTIVSYQGSQVNFDLLEQFGAVLWCPEGIRNSDLAFPQMIFGALNVVGQLPGHLFENQQPQGITSASIGRLKYAINNQLVNHDKLNQIDDMINQAIQEQYFPGCQVLMAKNGEVIYQKTFGYHTYDSVQAVNWDQLYDIASVTKTTATVPALMHLVDLNKISMEATLGELLPSFTDSDKAGLQVRDLLMHQSGLRSYIPFWRRAKMDSINYLYKKKNSRRSRHYSLVSIDWNDSINSWIAKSKFNSLQNDDGSFRYLYSDLGFMVLDEVVEHQTNQSLDSLIGTMLFEPIGMDFTRFNPQNHFSILRIAPTENDEVLRNRLVRGDVHDRNASLQGGVSGHAGLFSNANDLAKYMQMMLQQGYYGGKRYFDAETIALFNTKPADSYRRALGWDKPNKYKSNISRYASNESFGHSGFTGTLVWADPKHDLVYVFLSNRIYPDAKNNKLIESNFRTKIHDLMYESLLSRDTDENFGM